MNTVRLALATLALGLTSLVGSSQGGPTERLVDRLFPPAQQGLSLVANLEKREGMNLEELLQQVADATPLNFTYSPETQVMLKQAPLLLMKDVEVPPARVYPFYESILRASGFVIAACHDQEPLVFRVVCLECQEGRNIKSLALILTPDELEGFADHPGMMITTTVYLPKTDVRTLSNSMRSMITDPNTMQIIPVGNSHNLILTGFADQIAGLTRMLRAVDEALEPVPETVPAGPR